MQLAGLRAPGEPAEAAHRAVAAPRRRRRPPVVVPGGAAAAARAPGGRRPHRRAPVVEVAVRRATRRHAVDADHAPVQDRSSNRASASASARVGRTTGRVRRALEPQPAPGPAGLRHRTPPHERQHDQRDHGRRRQLQPRRGCTGSLTESAGRRVSPTGGSASTPEDRGAERRARRAGPARARRRGGCPAAPRRGAPRPRRAPLGQRRQITDEHLAGVGGRQRGGGEADGVERAATPPAPRRGPRPWSPTAPAARRPASDERTDRGRPADQPPPPGDAAQAGELLGAERGEPGARRRGRAAPWSRRARPGAPRPRSTEPSPAPMHDEPELGGGRGGQELLEVALRDGHRAEQQRGERAHPGGGGRRPSRSRPAAARPAAAGSRPWRPWRRSAAAR